MIYPANFEEKIGFDRIREQVSALCSMPSAVERLAQEGFSTSAEEIERRLSSMDEMRTLLMLEHDFPNDDYPDLAPLAAKIRVEGSYLLAAEAAMLRRGLATVGAVAGFVLGRGEERYPRLWALSRRVTTFPEIVRAIDAILDPYGEVKDTASPELQQVRRAIREREGQAAKRLQQVLQRAKQAGIVEADAVLSVRDGRTVIPVAAANKRKLQGFIHDESATGRTFYIEPVEVVEINNELKELEYAERREVVRILTTFTESIRPDAELIADAGDYLSEIDMIRAKARWALANRAGKPIVSTDDRLELSARKRSFQSLRDQFRLRDHGSGFFLPAVLTKRHKIDVFHMHQSPDIFKIHAKSVIGGNRDDQRPTVSHVGFCRHQHRRVGNPGGKLRQRIAGTGRDNHNVKKLFRAHRLRLGNGSNPLFPCNFRNFSHKILRSSETGVALQSLIGKHRCHIRPHLHQPPELSLDLFVGTERSGNSKSDPIFRKIHNSSYYFKKASPAAESVRLFSGNRCPEVPEPAYRKCLSLYSIPGRIPQAPRRYRSAPHPAASRQFLFRR